MSLSKLNSQPHTPAKDEMGLSDDTPPAVVPNLRAERGSPVLSADLNGNITGFNQAALDVFSRTPEEILGKPLAALVLPENDAKHLPLHQAILAAVLKQGEYRSRHPLQTQSGKNFIAELSVTLLRDGRSAPTGMVCSVLR